MNARLSKFALTTSLLLCTGLALLFCAGQALNPGNALAETPPPPPGFPSLPELPSTPAAVPTPAPSTPAAPAAPAPPAPSTAPAPATKMPPKAKKKPTKRAHCKHGKRCGRHNSKRGGAGTDASASAVVGGVYAGASARFSTCYHAVYGNAYNTSSLQSAGVWALPMMYDWATSRWSWPQSWTPADGITQWALTAYKPYEYAYVWFARYAGGQWQYSPEWVYVENDLDNGFCS
jgi:hypothetical protein